MNIQTFNIKKLLEEDFVWNNTMIIVIPRFHFDRTRKMCNASLERGGQIIFTKEITDTRTTYMAEYLDVVDKGAVEVNITRNTRLDARVGESIDFHTHQSCFNKYFWKNFSNGDLNTLAKRSKENRDYKHILFTPTHILFYGRPKVDLVITENDSEEVLKVIKQKHYYWRKTIKELTQ